MRGTKGLRRLLGPDREFVISGFKLVDIDAVGARPRLVVSVRVRSRRRARCGRCGRCGEVFPLHDRGGGERRWRNVDVGSATGEIIFAAPRVSCRRHGATVTQMSFAGMGEEPFPAGGTIREPSEQVVAAHAV